MEIQQSTPETQVMPFVPTMVIVSAVILVGALGFVGWSAEGANLFVTMVQNGLAWCL